MNESSEERSEIPEDCYVVHTRLAVVSKPIEQFHYGLKATLKLKINSQMEV